MSKTRHLRRRTKKMRGGNEKDMAILNRISDEQVVSSEKPTDQQPRDNEPAIEPSPEIEPSPAIPQRTKTIGEHVKNVTQKATNWLKGLFGIGEQTGGKSRNRRHRKTMKKMRKNRKH